MRFQLKVIQNKHIEHRHPTRGENKSLTSSKNENKYLRPTQILSGKKEQKKRNNEGIIDKVTNLLHSCKFKKQKVEAFSQETL